MQSVSYAKQPQAPIGLAHLFAKHAGWRVRRAERFAANAGSLLEEHAQRATKAKGRASHRPLFARHTPSRLPLAQGYANLASPMAKPPQRSIHLILHDARHQLGMSQEKFGSAVGSSHRTAVRWDAREASPGIAHLHALARLLYPRNRSLAIEVADAADETLVSLGLEAAPVSPPMPVASAVPLSETPARTRPEDLVDIVVLAAVEWTGSPPATVRPLLHAVFKRGCEIGLTMEAAEKALRPVVPTQEEPKVGAKGSTKRTSAMEKKD